MIDPSAFMDPQIKAPNWYVVTGGPSSGKTTLLKSLGKLGYYTVPEPARLIIDEHMARGITLQELRYDEAEWNRMVLQRSMQAEEGVPKDRTVFFDRAIPDNIAYHKLRGMSTEHIEAVAKGRYRKVFFMEPLHFYEKDYSRTEDLEIANRLSRLLLDAYRNLGYPVIEVPPVSVEERVSFVLSHL